MAPGGGATMEVIRTHTPADVMTGSTSAIYVSSLDG